MLPPLQPATQAELPDAPLAATQAPAGSGEAGRSAGQVETLVTDTQRLIYEHLRCIPVGMDDNALAYELAVLIGPTIAPCSEPREQQ
jgi:hypothetical protein